MDISSCKLHSALMPFKSHLLRIEDGRHIKVCGITCSLYASDFIINFKYSISEHLWKVQNQGVTPE